MTVNFVYETGAGPITPPTNVNPQVPNEPMILSPNNAGQIVSATTVTGSLILHTTQGVRFRSHRRSSLKVLTTS